MSALIVLVLFIAFTPKVYALTSHFYSYSSRSNYTIKTELIADTDLSIPEFDLSLVEQELELEEPVEQEPEIETVDPPTDELDLVSDLVVGEMAPWQPETMVDIEDLDIVPVIEPEEQDGAEEPEDLEDLGGWEEPDDLGGYPTGEE